MQPENHKLKRGQRLKSAAKWVLETNSKKLVSKYSKRYGVNNLTAVLELNQLGFYFDERQFLSRSRPLISFPPEKLISEYDAFPEF